MQASSHRKRTSCNSRHFFRLATFAVLVQIGIRILSTWNSSLGNIDEYNGEVFLTSAPSHSKRHMNITKYLSKINKRCCYLVVGPLSLTLRRPVERGWMNTVRQKVADFPHSSCTTQHHHPSQITFHPSSIHQPGPGIWKKSPP